MDTNVVVSALLTRNEDSPPVVILRQMLAGDLRYLLSVDLLAEYRAVLLRPKLARAHGLDETGIDVLLAELAANGAHREPEHLPASPDPNDAHLLALLDCEPRAVLVSGDELTLKAVEPGDRALTPRQYLDRCRSR